MEPDCDAAQSGRAGLARGGTGGVSKWLWVRKVHRAAGPRRKPRQAHRSRRESTDV